LLFQQHFGCQQHVFVVIDHQNLAAFGILHGQVL
jgi:hypothetical protein